MGALILTHNQISHMFDHEMGPKSLRKGVFQVQALRRSRSCADQISAKKPVKDRPVILKILEVWQGTMWCPTAFCTTCPVPHSVQPNVASKKQPVKCPKNYYALLFLCLKLAFHHHLQPSGLAHRRSRERLDETPSVLRGAPRGPRGAWFLTI